MCTLPEKTFLNYLDYYIPDTVIEIDEILKDTKLDYGAKENFKSETKISNIASFDGNEGSVLKAYINMVDNMFVKTNVDSKSIAFLVCGSELLLNNPNYSIAHYLKHKFKMENAVILPLLQPCASSVFAMGLLGKLLKNNQYAIVLSGVNLSNKHRSRFLDFTVIGDGLSLVLVSGSPGICEVDSWYTHSFSDSSIRKVEEKLETRILLNFRKDMISNGTKFIINSMASKGITFDEIEKFISGNVRNDVFERLYSLTLGISSNLFFLDNIPFGGHMNDVDIVRNLKDYLKNRVDVNQQKYIILYAPDLQASYDVNYHLIILKM